METQVTNRCHHVHRRFGRAQDGDMNDPYGQMKKPSSPAVCPDCRAVFHDGRWQWLAAPANADAILCQACHRIRDGYPAGELRLAGPFSPLERRELEALARHHEADENKDHPLNRIISVTDDDDAMVITTTDIHLPHRIGQAVRRAYHGKLDVRYDPGTYFVRALWTRNEGRKA